MFKKFKRKSNSDLVITRRNILRIKVACETILNDKTLSNEDKIKIIDLMRMDANYALTTIQHYIKES